MEQNEQSNSSSKFMEALQKLYERFNVFSEFKEDDGILLLIGKVIIRIIGFFILLLLSPFIIIGLIIAFLAAL